MTVKRSLRLKHRAPAQIDANPLEHSQLCPLCGRELLNDASVDEHHLVPKSKGGREKFRVHKLCHKMIHATLTESQLSRDYARWDLLQAQPDIATFISWVAGKPPELMLKIRRGGSRRR